MIVSCLFLEYHSVDVFLFLSGYLFIPSFLNRRYFRSRHGQPALCAIKTHVYHRYHVLFPICLVLWIMLGRTGLTTCKHPRVVFSEIFDAIIFRDIHGSLRDAQSQSMCNVIAWSVVTDIQAHFVMAVILSLLYYIFPRHSSENTDEHVNTNNRDNNENDIKRRRHFENIIPPPRFAALSIIILILLQFISRYTFVRAFNTSLKPNLSNIDVNQPLTRKYFSAVTAAFNLTSSHPVCSALQPSNTNENLVRDVQIVASPQFQTMPVYLGVLLWLLLYMQRDNSEFWRCVEKNGNAMMKTAIGGTILLYGLFATLPRVMSMVNVTKAAAFAVALYECLYRFLFSLCVALFVVAVSNPTMISVTTA